MAMVLVMGSMTACGSKDETANTNNSSTGGDTATKTETKDITLTVWSPQDDQADFSKVDAKYGDNLLAYMCEAFNEAHPEWNITFKYAVCSEGDAYTELSKDAAAGADVFMYAGDQATSLIKNGIAQPLLGLDDVKANNGERAIQAVTNGSDTYGVPFTPNTWFLYYDKSKLSEEDVQSLDTIMSKDIAGTPYNFTMDLDNGWYNGAFFYSAGCTTTFDDDKDVAECDFNSANGLAAANIMLGLAKNKKFLCDDDTHVGLASLKKGKVAAYCSGTWDAEPVKKALGDNYAATKLPTINVNGEEKQMNSIGDYKYLGVNANSENVDAAQALAIWLGSEECQLDRFIARGVSPTWKSLTENEDVKNDIATTALAEQNQYTVITPASEKFNTNYWPAMEALGAGMVNGEITEKNVQKNLDKTVENITTSVSK